MHNKHRFQSPWLVLQIIIPLGPPPKKIQKKLLGNHSHFDSLNATSDAIWVMYQDQWHFFEL